MITKPRTLSRRGRAADRDESNVSGRSKHRLREASAQIARTLRLRASRSAQGARLLGALLLLLVTACGTSDGGACPPNRVDRMYCVRCGPTDGCEQTERTCVPVCATNAQCDDGRTCINGGCVPIPCG